MFSGKLKKPEELKAILDRKKNAKQRMRANEAKLHELPAMTLRDDYVAEKTVKPEEVLGEYSASIGFRTLADAFIEQLKNGELTGKTIAEELQNILETPEVARIMTDDIKTEANELINKLKRLKFDQPIATKDRVILERIFTNVSLLLQQNEMEPEMSVIDPDASSYQEISLDSSSATAPAPPSNISVATTSDGFGSARSPSMPEEDDWEITPALPLSGKKQRPEDDEEAGAPEPDDELNASLLKVANDYNKVKDALTARSLTMDHYDTTYRLVRKMGYKIDLGDVKKKTSITNLVNAMLTEKRVSKISFQKYTDEIMSNSRPMKRMREKIEKAINDGWKMKMGAAGSGMKSKKSHTKKVSKSRTLPDSALKERGDNLVSAIRLGNRTKMVRNELDTVLDAMVSRGLMTAKARMKLLKSLKIQ